MLNSTVINSMGMLEEVCLYEDIQFNSLIVHLIVPHCKNLFKLNTIVHLG